MMVCDYNGWNDAPEDEREALDLIEAALAYPARPVLSKVQPGKAIGRVTGLEGRRLAA
ncbi:MAG TPA: hypothetical protein VH763_07875 [Gemmatimonadales bacterium]|jgi:hypothetical protein